MYICTVLYFYIIPGKTETPLEMLRSIMAQLHYQHEVFGYEKKGVPFSSHMYVPEVHPQTGEPFHEREDEAHVFKVFLVHLHNLHTYYVTNLPFSLHVCLYSAAHCTQSEKWWTRRIKAGAIHGGSVS